MENNLKISYYGYFTPMGGYGIANLNWVKNLKRLGVDVSVHPKFEPKIPSLEWSILDDEERAIFGEGFEKRRIGIIETNPFDFDTIDTEIKIANTMCESDHINKTWTEKLNRMDYIIVPNDFNKEVFERCGVTKPIKVITHGLDHKRFPYFERPERDIFTFGIIGYLDQNDRKGAFDLIQAFCSEFDNDEPVRLILKSSDPSFGYYRYFTDNRIKTVTTSFPPNELNKLYREFDCFVFPSKVEGIGYPPREAMSTGLPTIVTDWSGLRDIAMPEICYPLSPKKFAKRPNFIEQDGNWAIIDIQELMYQMRYVYEHRKEAKEKGKKASEYIQKYFSWELCAEELKVFLETL